MHYSFASRAVLFLFVISIFAIPPASAAIPTTEREALVALYASTNGDAWVNNTGWNGPVGTECTWFGITCFADHVTAIDLSYNELAGSIPPDLAKLTEMLGINFWWNRLSGTIPPELGSLPALQSLGLGYNELTGPIPPQLGNLANLQLLDLCENHLSGTIPPEFGNLTRLTYLRLSTNELTGPIPLELTTLSNLTQFEVILNHLSGPIPPELGNLTRLGSLGLAANEFTGPIPPELGKLTNLSMAWMGTNNFTGSIPVEFARLPWRVLYLNDTQISGPIPREFGDAPLNVLVLRGNQLSGPIPPELGNLTDLYQLDLSDNQLSGAVPPELGNLTSVRMIELSRNRFTGSLPAELGNLEQLEHFGAGSNGLTGDVPGALLGATSLVSLNLYYNALSATDPTVYNWIEARSSGWFATQTSPPTTISAMQLCETEVEVMWSGGFAATRSEIWLDDGTGFALVGSTPSNSFSVTGLSPATHYEIVIRSISEPSSLNDNWLESEFSAPFSATTTVIARFASVTVPEGSSGPAARTFSVTLDTPPPILTTIQWITYGGDASADDFASATGVLTFAPGEVTKTFEVMIIGDTLDEPDETFQIGISSATGVCTHQPAMVTIADDDGPPTISVGDVTEVEGTDTWHQAQIPVTLDAPSGHTLEITWSALAQTATENDDYIVYPDTFRLLPGQTSATLTVVLIPDSIDEPDETLTIAVSGANLNIPGNGVVTITDDDAPPNLGNYDIWIGEDDAGTPQASATFTLDNVSGWTSTVEWTLIGETATSGADFAPASGVLTFAPGQTWKQVAVPVLDDTIDEELETFKLVFTNAAHISVPLELQGTIADDDLPPTPRVTQQSVIEGDSGTNPRTLTVALSNTSSRTVAFDWAIRSLGALAGQDFVDVTGTVTFLPGETEKSITVEIFGDTTYEWDETFAISMTGAEGLASTNYIAIANDDSKPNLSISDTRVSEGDDGTRIEAITVRLDAPSGRNVNFEWGTSPGTASAGSDYIPTSGTGFFPTGTTASLVYVEIIGDTAVDYGETLYVHVTAADEATIVDGKAECVIMDDDVAPRVPDPVIQVTGCIEVDAPCELTVLSGTQWDQTDWSYVWSVDGVARGNTQTWSPNFTEAGTYAVTLVTTNDEGSGAAAVTLLLAESTGRCPEGNLCMHSKRFLLALSARDQRTDRTVPGVPLRQNDIFGYFALPALTGSAAIPEVFVKVIDGRPVNGNFWNFYGGLTDLEYTLTVTDTVTGDTRSYLKPAGSTAGGFDTGSGVVPETCTSEVDGTEIEPVEPNLCAGGVGGLCLQGARFLVEVTARDQRTGRTGTGLAVPQNDIFGYFALPELTSNGANPEIFVKVIDGRSVNGSYWIFYGGLTDLEYTVTITDTMRGMRNTYTKAAGSACGAFDTDAF